MISVKGRSKPFSSLVQKIKDEEKHACDFLWATHPTCQTIQVMDKKNDQRKFQEQV